jgi:hypothetical protein
MLLKVYTSMKSIVHVNQHHIKANHKNGTNLPVITIKQGGKTLYAWGVNFTGSSSLEYHECDPLSCGARVWMTTNDPIVLLDENNQPFDGISFSQLHTKNVTLTL